MHAFEEIARPVLFNQHTGEYRYWGKGSSLLISNPRNYYWVTAGHVLSNLNAPVSSLCIFPSDNTRISLPFDLKTTIVKAPSEYEGYEDDEYKDILLLRIDLQGFDKSGDAPLIAQDIDQGTLAAEELSPGAELWVIGYPAESNIIDYDEQRIISTRSVLRATYEGSSVSDHCHKLKMECSIRLESYDGLSGSPIFHFVSRTVDGETLEYPLLVGMLLRGTPSSSIAHFVSSRVLVSLISAVEKNI
jgi:hypothetical protein